MQQTFPPVSTRRFLTTGTAAELASCHRTTIMRAIERSELQAVRVGRNGDHRIRVESFEEWLRPTGPDNEEATA